MEIGKKQLQIILAGKSLFYKYGIKKVTVEDVCKEAQISKMTFYKYYSNKIELVKGLLNYLSDSVMDEFVELMNSDIPFSDKLMKILEIKVRIAKNVSMEFVTTLYQSDDPTISTFVTEYIQNSLKRVMKVFEDAQERGVMRKDIKPILLMAFFDKAQEIAANKEIVAAYTNAEELVYEINKFFMYGLSDPK